MNVGKQAFLGLVEISLSSLLGDGMHTVDTILVSFWLTLLSPLSGIKEPTWYPLQKRSAKSNVRGDLQIQAYLTGLQAPMGPKRESSTDASSSPQANRARTSLRCLLFKWLH